MNPGLAELQPYPFARLAALTQGITPAPQSAIAFGIGEPQHAAPKVIVDALANHLDGIGKYPLTRGEPALRTSIATWLTRRFKLSGIDAERQVLPVTGTREALFSIAQALITPGSAHRVICPNPFYQIYEGAAILAGTTPRFVNSNAKLHHRPDFSQLSDADWDQCQLLYLCNPGNPSGAVIPQNELQELIERAHEYDFVIVSDECYSEIYPDEAQPPVGLLEVAESMGVADFRHCLVFHSLSKRSNVPGMRSGFVAGDADLISTFLKYRTYHGCAMPLHHQIASIAAWSDEDHVIENRARYREKFAAVTPILQPYLDVTTPDAGFYLWPRTPCDDETFAVELLRHANVTVLPGRYLSRMAYGVNPGEHYARLALVAELDQCIEGARRIATVCEALWS